MLLVVAHMFITWIGLVYFQENHLTGLVTFPYYYFTTASTIGYGDLSTVTPGGRAFAIIFLFPGALSFYMALLAKVTQTVISAWRKRMDGYGDFSSEKGRTVILGYLPGVTQRVIKDLLAGGLEPHQMVIMATEIPRFDHEEIDFVLTEDLSQASDLVRSGVVHAKNVLVMAKTDDATFTTSMAVSHMAKNARIVAAVECETRAELLRAHTDVVPVVSQSPEVVASEVLDPGVSMVLGILGAASKDVTAFSVQTDCGPLNAGQAHTAFRQLGMTFLGAHSPKLGLQLNPSDETDVSGLALYYIAKERVNENAFRGAVFATKQKLDQLIEETNT
jgi:voltage-gated potassium channel